MLYSGGLPHCIELERGPCEYLLNLSRADWGSQPAGSQCQRQPGFGEASHNPLTMRILARILREHPSGGLEGAYSIMVRGSIHSCVRQGCGQLAALLSQLQPVHSLKPP